MLKIYTDAATKGNPGPTGLGILIIGAGLHQQLTFPLSADYSNHEAEFIAVYFALNYLIQEEMTAHNLFLYTDSKIVASSVEKNYAGQANFQKWLDKINLLIEKFPLVLCQWIPEKQNKGADQLAKQALQQTLKNRK